MSSFGSAVINKSNKKFAPKAPAPKKRPPASTPASAHPQNGAAPTTATDSAPSVQTSLEVNKATSAQPVAASVSDVVDRVTDVPLTHQPQQASSDEHGSTSDRPAKRRRTGDGPPRSSSLEESAVQTAAGRQVLDRQAVHDSQHILNISRPDTATEDVVREDVAEMGNTARTFDDGGALVESDSNAAGTQNTPENTVDIVMSDAEEVPALERSRSEGAEGGIPRGEIVTPKTGEKGNDAAQAETEGGAQSMDVVQDEASAVERTDVTQSTPLTLGSGSGENGRDENTAGAESSTQENVRLESGNAEVEQTRTVTQAEEPLPVESTVPTAGETSQAANDESSTIIESDTPAAEIPNTELESDTGQTRDDVTKEIPKKTAPKKAPRSKKSAQPSSQSTTTDAPATDAQAAIDSAEDTATAGRSGTAQSGKVRKPRKSKTAAPQSTTTEFQAVASMSGQDAVASTRKTRRPRKKAPPKTPRIVIDDDNDDENAEASTENAGGAEDEENSQDGASERRKSGRKRAVTPEGAEDIEINVETTTMYELCRDRRQGRKSQREAEFQNIDWTEVAKRRKAAEARALAGEENEQEREEAERRKEAAERQKQGQRGPQLRLVNGQMILDTGSASGPRPAGLDVDSTDAAIEESDLTKRVNSQSWLYAHRRNPAERYASAAKSDPWSEELTDQFYGALSMFGTDFCIVARMIPGKTRRMIKNKFVREERADPQRIRAALMGEDTVPMDLQKYCEASGQEVAEMRDPEVLERELRELDETQRTEIEAQRAGVAEKAREKMEAAKAKAEAGKKRKGRKKGGGAGGEEVPMPGEGEMAAPGTAGV